ncbi:site-specific integrase [Algiphilus sp.]|uniref:site-specific integrase n=1 Tax=Algiphilus sp. TaxID=1872431 RepID=UPI0025BD525D|nr:site-specific integrase [Algiphilus sp.]MCK5771800.1 site-specific integrase [Algiphilus sp.]
MATLVRTSAGTWKAVIRRRGWPTTTKSFRTKRDAEDWSRRVEDEMVRGVYVQRTSSERTLFTQAMRQYLAEVTPTKRPSTQKSDHQKADTLIEFFGAYSLQAITPALVASYRDQRLASKVKPRYRQRSPVTKLVSPGTVRRELALLGHVFTVALKEWGIGLTANPVQSIRRPAPGDGRNRRLRPDEERQLMSALAKHSNPMLRWIVVLALETGMRSSEISSLRTDQVDINRRVVRLDVTKNGSARTVPLSRRAAQVLQEALDHPIRPKGCSLIFFGEPGQDGERRPYQFKKTWVDMKSRLGFADLRFHDLRHEAVSRMVEAGLSDQEVSAISGHRSMQMLKRYTHLRAEDLVPKLDAVGGEIS